MIEVWILKICFGISALGCGGISIIEYPNEDACYKALAAMHVDTEDIKASDKRRSMYAVCFPKKRPVEE